MKAANSIYDVAALLIGRITGVEMQSLTVSSQESAVRRTPDAPERDLPLTLLRMDFAARVRTADGDERQVLIEIQKASAPTVIERFRRYLGQQIGSGDNILTHPSGRTEAVPIVTIYFLGYALDGLSDEAVIDVCPRVIERRTGRELAVSHPLVEGIHHRSHIIQIPRLASRRRDELERLLAIFDQGLVKGNGRGDAHVLTIAEGSTRRSGPSCCGTCGKRWRRRRCGACSRRSGVVAAASSTIGRSCFSFRRRREAAGHRGESRQTKTPGPASGAALTNETMKASSFTHPRGLPRRFITPVYASRRSLPHAMQDSVPPAV